MTHRLSLYLFRMAVLLVIYSCAGCFHYRYTAVALVDDTGPQIVTKNRYRLVEHGLDNMMPKTGVQNYDVARKMYRDNMQSDDRRNERLKATQPHVFSDDGIPIIVRCVYTPSSFTGDGERFYEWTTFFPFAISLFTLPKWGTGIEPPSRYEVDVVDNPDAHGEFETMKRGDYAISLLTPLPLLFYRGEVGLSAYSKNKKYIEHQISVGEEGISTMKVSEKAYAYGLASVLKKMEDAGKIKTVPSGRDENGNSDEGKLMNEKFELLEFGREEQREYCYSFTFRSRSGNISFRDSRNLQKELRATIRNDYLASFPTTERNSLVVDLTEYGVTGNQIKGRAMVLMLQVLSLDYNQHTRNGIISIRINANQYEDARNYIRKNIESLVRYKNVVIKSDTLPSSARFFLLGERFKEGTYEVDFKAE